MSYIFGKGRSNYMDVTEVGKQVFGMRKTYS